MTLFASHQIGSLTIEPAPAACNSIVAVAMPDTDEVGNDTTAWTGLDRYQVEHLIEVLQEALQ